MMAMLKAGVPPVQANLMSHCYQMAEKWWGVGMLSPTPPSGQETSPASNDSSIGQGKSWQKLFS
jgi:hypothetical protein